MPDTYFPTPTALPSGVRRESVRPPEFRDASFDQEYDATTLYYDAVWNAGRVVLLGPPLHDLEPVFTDMVVVARPSGQVCRSTRRSLELHEQIWVEAPSGTEQLLLKTASGDVVVDVSPPTVSPFVGRRVLSTMSKDNDLTWIEDWVRFHRDVHGADAVLIYDNGSTAYTTSELLDTLRGLDGVKAALVVSWPFKYGPQGYKQLGFWDSAYSQPAAFEHARWSLLSDARSVMNGDVDELVHAKRGRRLFESAESSAFGVLRYNGLWVPTTDRTRVGPVPRHRDFEHYTKAMVDWRRRPPRRGFSAPKWTVVPRRCPARAQWLVHRIHRWPAGAAVTPSFTYRHYRRLSTGWKYDRGDVEPYDPAVHVYDASLVDDFSKVCWTR